MDPQMSSNDIWNQDVPEIVIISERQSTARQALEANHSYLYDNTPDTGDAFARLNAPLDGSTLVQAPDLRSPFGPDYPYLKRKYPNMRGLSYRLYNSIEEVETDGRTEDDAASSSSSSSVEYLYTRRRVAAQVRTFIPFFLSRIRVPRAKSSFQVKEEYNR